MVTFDEIRKQLRTPIQSKTTPNIPSFDEIRNTVRAETVQNNLQIMRANPTPKPQPLPDISPTPQPLQSNFIDSYLKPFQPSNNADVPIGPQFEVNPNNKILPAVEGLNFKPVKKYGYAITPNNEGIMEPGPVTRKEGPRYNKEPLEIVGETDTAYVYQINGYLQAIPKSMVTDTPIKDVNEMNRRWQQHVDQTNLKTQQRREQEYAAKNPIDRFFTKATDIGFRQDDKTPSLGNPVADVAAGIAGGIMGLATPTGGGQSLGGAMNTAGDLVEYGLNKWGGKLINKLPGLTQKIVPKAIKEVGEGLVYSASKAPDYDTKDWVQNAVEDATLGTGLGLLMDGAKNIPDIVKKAQDNSKSKAIDKAYDALKTDMFITDGVKTQRPTNTQFNTALKNLSPGTLKKESEPIKSISDPVNIKPFEVNKQTMPMEERTLTNIGSKKVNAYQYDNPQVKNEIQAYAEYIKNNELLSGPNKIEPTSPVMKKLKEVTKASYAEIDKALNSIIKNEGAENYAIAKRVEMVIDDMLTNGFENIKGEKWGADKVYLAKKSIIEGKSIKSVDPESKYLKGEELPIKPIAIAEPKKINDLTKLSKFEPIGTTITKLERSKSMLEFQSNMMKDESSISKQKGMIDNLNSKIEALKAKQKLIPDDINELKSFINGMDEQQKKGIGIDLQLFAEAKEKLRKLERGFSKNIRTDNYIDDSIRKSFEEKPLTYDPLSNKETLSKAEAIYSKGFNTALDEWNRNLGNFRPEDIPLSKMLANKAIENGDMDLARRIISDSAEKLTKAGQYSQAARILRQSDPGATNIFVQGQLDKLNKDGAKRYGKKWKDIELTDEELKLINSMEGKPDGEREKIMEEIFNRLTKQLPVTNMEKFDAWRRIAMLLNPKTHVRNVIGNVLMKGLRVSSDKLGAVIEKVAKVPEGQRTKALRWKNDSNLVNIVNKNWEINKKELLQEGRFDIESLRFLNREKPIFKTKWLEKVNQFSKDTLNLEDMVFFKDAYKDSLGQYMKANRLQQVTKQAQEYATDKAMEATFKKTNQLATWISQAKSKGGLIGKGTEALIPFSKTPSNILTSSVDYSPAGFLNLLYSKNKTPAQVIETISKGLTGTALVGVGFGLASMGWMRLNRKNSKNAEELLGLAGEQPNSVNTPLGSYTFDWAQPFAVPLAMGIAVFESLEKNEDVFSTVTNAVAAGGDTFFNMSMLQNIKELMGGRYDSTTEGLMELPVSYLEQGFPTVFGQVTRAIDPIKRNTYDPNPVKSFGKKIMAKTPYLSTKLEPKIDPFGREQKQNSPLEQFLSPGYTKGKDNSSTVKEIARLYKSTKETDFLPKSNVKKFTYKGKDIVLTDKQMTELQREMGNNNLTEISSLINSSKYKNADDEDKAKLIKKVTTESYNKAKESIVKKYYAANQNK